MIKDTISKNEEDFSLKSLIFILFAYKSLILKISSVLIFCTFVYVLSMKPIYRSSGLIMIENSSQAMGIFDMDIGSDKNFIENEIKILKSRTIGTKAITELLNSSNRDRLYLLGTGRFKPNFLQNIFKNYPKKQFLENAEVSDSLMKVFNNSLHRNLVISSPRNTDMIKLTYESLDPYESALIINTIIEVYVENDRSWANGELLNLKNFLLNQIVNKEIELSKSENDLKDFQEKEDFFNIDNNSELILENLNIIESMLSNVNVEYNVLSERKKYFVKQLTEEETKLTITLSNSINNRLESLRKEIAIKESELITAISQQGENHPIVKSIEDKISKLKNSLKIETSELISSGISVADPIEFRQSLMDSIITFNSQLSMLTTKQEELNKLIEKYDLEIENLPNNILQYTKLVRNLNIHSETYSLMRSKLEETKINEAAQIGKVKVVDYAVPNFVKVSPNRRYELLSGFVISIILSILICLIINYFDTTIKTTEDLDKYNLSILTMVPTIGSKYSDKKRKKSYKNILGDVEKIQRRLITHEDPKSPISEAYRSLRTALLYTRNGKDESDKKGEVILVSSSGPGEGKTTTLVNLAIAYANMGKKTVVIDTDLRKPVIHKIFSKDRTIGISKYLTNQIDDYKEIINDTEVENLSVIFSGLVPPNPSEILSSEKMSKFIEELKLEYDIILLDSPPILAVTDPIVLMKNIDQFVLVVRARKTDKGGLARALDTLIQSNSPLSGIVLNDIDQTTSYGSGYYYNYYQYYYGDDK